MQDVSQVLTQASANASKVIWEIRMDHALQVNKVMVLNIIGITKLHWDF